MIRFGGDAGGLQDWYGIALGSAGALRDIKLDTGALTGTTEQTHAVRVTGPAAGAAITRVTFVHPQRSVVS